jgi:2-C-methyl-D-erythritol 4-phosphate cytidylyltransferase
MTKKELIEAMKDYTDDALISIWCGFDCRNPAGTYSIIKVDYDQSFPERITFQMDYD